MKKFSLLIVITIIITSSCKKTGDSFEFTNQQKITKFLSVRDNHSQLIKRIAKSIEDDNRNKNYLEAIIDKLGNPIWDKIITNKKSSFLIKKIIIKLMLNKYNLSNFVEHY